MSEVAAQSRMRDTRAGYGWVSIALHWLGALVVLTLWFIGSSIGSAGAQSTQRLNLHTSIALCAYALVWARVIWRFRVGHPQPLPAQRGIGFAIGRLVHLSLLVVIAAMLVTGPLTAWLRGDAIQVFGLVVASPFGAHVDAADFMHRCHVWGANAILIGTLLHIGGTLKHVAFDKDGTLERMLVAGPRGTATRSRVTGEE